MLNKRTRIKSIKIKNYRQYKEMNFDFPFQKKHDLHIIIAKNGVGKSNFLNAITWCLYAEENHLQEKSKALPIVNLDTIANVEEKGSIEVSVELVVEVNGEEKVFQRNQTFVKSSKEKTGVVSISVPNLVVTGKFFDPQFGCFVPDVIDGEHAELLIKRIFPQAINEYFFFDNEQMNNYFTTNEGGSIQKAINMISKIKVVQDLLERVRRLRVEKKRLAKNSSNLSVYINKEEECRIRLEEVENELQRLNVEFNAGQQQIAKLSEAIKGAEKTKEIEVMRSRTEDNINRLVQEENKLKIEIDKFIVRYTTLLKMYPLLQKTNDYINELGKRRQLPPEISMEILKRSLKEEKCGVCDSVLSEAQAKKILELLETYNVSSPSYELLLRNHAKIKELMKETEKYKEKRDDLIRRQRELTDKLDKERDKLIELENDLKTIANKDDIIKKIERRDELQSALYDKKTEIGRKEHELKMAKTRLEKAENDYLVALKRDENNKVLLEEICFMERIISILDKAAEELMLETRDEISQQTYKNFVSLIWKKNTYKGIVIDENYNVDLIHNKGYSAIGSTSAAERSLLALSFTNAIHNVSGFESPLVIDSPVGRVSDDNRRKFAESLAEVSKDKQVIMLFTPDEYSHDVAIVFDGIAKKAKAEMNESEDYTNIRRI